MSDIYTKLADHLRNTPGGFPPTPSGVELKILEKLFTEQEAEVALHLIMMPETAETIASRIGWDVDVLLPVLQTMVQKGLAVHSTKGGMDTYMQAQFVVGIWEYQVESLDRELIGLFNEYVPYLMEEQKKQKTQQLRVIPVSEAVSADMNIMDYEKAEDIIKAQSKIVVAPCICRKEHEMIGEGCGKPIETCLVFGTGAYFYEERGIGRTIEQKEALDILHKGIEHGLVLQPGNAKKPINICMCCGCCCQILKNIKTSEKPARIVNTSYFAEADPETCTACEACSDICPMEAITMTDHAQVNTDRCIGCGVCVTACEFESISLKSKTDSERWEPPANIVETYMNIAKEKGLL